MNIDFYTNVSRIGNNVLVRGIRNGKAIQFKHRYEPTLYIEHEKDFGYTNLYGKNLKPIKFDTMTDLREFADQHSQSNLKIYGFPNFHSQFALEYFPDAVDKFDKSLIRTYFIDIEVTSSDKFPEPGAAEYPITALCLYDSVTDKFVTFGIGEWDQQDSILPDDIADKVVYIPCQDEMKLLAKFMQYWTTFPPNIVTGWNTEFFDLPYIVNRLNNLGFDATRLSPWGKVGSRRVPGGRNGEDQFTADIVGVDHIDYLPLYKKNKVQDSYRLDNIAKVELGEEKSLGTVEMLDMSRVPFVTEPAVTVYNETDDEEFNRFARARKLRVETQLGNNPNKDMELITLLKQEKKAAFQAFISYNIQDVNLVKRLDDKLGLLDAHIMIAYEACMNFSEVNSPVRTWDCLVNKEMHKNKQIPHFFVDKKETQESIPGGYVKEPQVGKHGWCVSFDLNSLYPHLIMQFNISPETLDPAYRLWTSDVNEEDRVKRLLDAKWTINDAHEDKYSVSAGGYRFSNDFEGIIPRLMRKMYDDRKAFKKQMIAKQKRGEDATLENLKQYVLKILLNSGYGAFINKYFRWFDLRLGKSITLSGQYVIQLAEKAINEWMNKVVGTEGVDYIIAIDTDSNYVNFQPLVDKFFSDKSREEIVDIIDKISEEQVQAALNKAFENAAKYLNAFDQKMVMEREAISSSAFWTAKKRYAMCVWDMEGVRMPSDKPKLKIQGLEAIRSSTPYACRKPLLTVIEKTLLENEEDVQRYIAEYKKEFTNYSLDQMAMPRSMNNLNKYDTKNHKGIPAHARGALVFNDMLIRHDLTTTWEKIKSGEKGKFLYLMQPNSVGENVISFVSGIPKEFDVEKYVDKNKMFEKIIMDPASLILEPLGWSAEKKITLESFFG